MGHQNDADSVPAVECRCPTCGNVHVHTLHAGWYYDATFERLCHQGPYYQIKLDLVRTQNQLAYMLRVLKNVPWFDAESEASFLLARKQALDDEVRI
jgi:hypothetical protein